MKLRKELQKPNKGEQIALDVTELMSELTLSDLLSNIHWAVKVHNEKSDLRDHVQIPSYDDVVFKVDYDIVRVIMYCTITEHAFDARMQEYKEKYDVWRKFTEEIEAELNRRGEAKSKARNLKLEALQAEQDRIAREIEKLSKTG